MSMVNGGHRGGLFKAYGRCRHGNTAGRSEVEKGTEKEKIYGPQFGHFGQFSAYEDGDRVDDRTLAIVLDSEEDYCRMRKMSGRSLVRDSRVFCLSASPHPIVRHDVRPCDLE